MPETRPLPVDASLSLTCSTESDGNVVDEKSTDKAVRRPVQLAQGWGQLDERSRCTSSGDGWRPGDWIRLGWTDNVDDALLRR